MSRASVETYRRIEADGTLSERRWQVYMSLWRHETERPELGLTHNEISHYVAEIHQFPEGYRNNTVARLCELEQQGVVRRVGEIMCPRSGDLCTTWMTVNRMPVELRRPVKRRFWLLMPPEGSGRRGYAYRVETNARRHQRERHPDMTLIEAEERRP